jgi:glucose/arabinose dehydrogenase
LLGKILRITPDGSIPGDNPFLGNGTARCNERGHTRRKTKCREIFTTGLRNPFRFAFDPNGSRFFINDVGGVKWEEIDEGASGANYGWNRREGPCKAGSTSQCGDPPSSVTDPIFAYRHTTGCDVITGAAFVPDGLWPGFDGVYLFADFACSKIFVLTPDGSGGFDANFNEPFATQLDGPVSMRFGPYNATQALYYATFRTGGQIRRIIYTP